MLNKAGFKQIISTAGDAVRQETIMHLALTMQYVIHRLSLPMVQHACSKILCLLTLGWHIVLFPP
jgi:hypothetical protein